MASISIKCPECGLALKVAEESLGKKIRCKECEHVFRAEAPTGKSAKKDKAITTKPDKAKAKSKGKGDAKTETKPPPAPARKPVDDDEDGPKNYGVTDTELGARCPECANEMGEGDIVCIHCGFNTQTRQRAIKRKVKDVTGSDIFTWQLPGYLCALVTLLFLTGIVLNIVFWTPTVAWFGEDWSGLAKGLLLWWTVFDIWIIYVAGKFAVKRLIINNMPPEEEDK